MGRILGKNCEFQQHTSDISAKNLSPAPSKKQKYTKVILISDFVGLEKAKPNPDWLKTICNGFAAEKQMITRERCPADPPPDRPKPKIVLSAGGRGTGASARGPLLLAVRVRAVAVGAEADGASLKCIAGRSSARRNNLGSSLRRTQLSVSRSVLSDRRRVRLRSLW